MPLSPIQSEPTEAVVSRRSPLLAVAAVGFVIFAAALIAVTRPRFQEWIQGFEIPLSVITSIALAPGFPILLGLVAMMTLAKECIRPLSEIANGWNVIVIGLAIACLTLYLVGLCLPLFTILRGLS